MEVTTFAITALVFYVLGVAAGHNKDNWEEE